MSSFDVTVDVEKSIEDIQLRAERIGGGLGPDWAGPAISAEIAVIERERFLSQGKGQWPPLALSTVEARFHRRGHYATSPMEGVNAVGPVLMWSGRLFFSLADPRGKGSPDSIVRMKQTSLVQGTRVPYAAKHQYGEGGPRRKVIDFDAEDRARLIRVWEEFVLE